MIELLKAIFSKLTPTAWAIIFAIIAVGVTIAIAKSDLTDIVEKWMDSSQKDHQQIISNTTGLSEKADNTLGQVGEIKEITLENSKMATQLDRAVSILLNMQNEAAGWYRIITSKERDKYNNKYYESRVIIDPMIMTPDLPLQFPKNHFEVLIDETFCNFKWMLKYSHDIKEYSKYYSELTNISDSFSDFSTGFANDSPRIGNGI